MHAYREGGLALAHANERAKENIRAAIQTVMTDFLKALFLRDDKTAAAHCSRSLRQTMEKSAGASARLRELRDFEAGRQFPKEEVELRFLRRSARISGSATQGSERATYGFDFVLEDSEWKINDFSFETQQLITIGELMKKIAHAVTGRPSPASPEPIKVSRSGVYHRPGGRFYASVSAVKEFATEAEAKAAGYRASRRG